MDSRSFSGRRLAPAHRDWSFYRGVFGNTSFSGMEMEGYQEHSPHFSLLKAGYTYVPYSSLESVVEQNKEDYYLALRRASRNAKERNSKL